MTCPNCGAELEGRWCHACGQDSDVRTDSLRGFVRENLSDLAHLDSRGLRTLRDLLIRPGRLTAAYFAGHRVRYLTPVQVYLIAAAVFFLVNSVSSFLTVDADTWSAHGALGVMGISETAEPADTLRYAARGITPAHFRQHLEATASKQLPAFLVGVVLGFGLLVALAYPLRERNLLKHFVFALHWTSFFLLLAMVERATGTATDQPGILSGILAVAGLVWLSTALRRVYGQAWLVALPKAVVLYLAFHLLLALWVGTILFWGLRTL